MSYPSRMDDAEPSFVHETGYPDDFGDRIVCTLPDVDYVEEELGYSLNAVMIGGMPYVTPAMRQLMREVLDRCSQSNLQTAER